MRQRQRISLTNGNYPGPTSWTVIKTLLSHRNPAPWLCPGTDVLISESLGLPFTGCPKWKQKNQTKVFLKIQRSSSHGVGNQTVRWQILYIVYGYWWQLPRAAQMGFISPRKSFPGDVASFMFFGVRPRLRCFFVWAHSRLTVSCYI